MTWQSHSGNHHLEHLLYINPFVKCLGWKSQLWPGGALSPSGRKRIGKCHMARAPKEVLTRGSGTPFQTGPTSLDKGSQKDHERIDTWAGWMWIGPSRDRVERFSRMKAVHTKAVEARGWHSGNLECSHSSWSLRWWEKEQRWRKDNTNSSTFLWVLSVRHELYIHCHILFQSMSMLWSSRAGFWPECPTAMPVLLALPWGRAVGRGQVIEASFCT